MRGFSSPQKEMAKNLENSPVHAQESRSIPSQDTFMRGAIELRVRRNTALETGGFTHIDASTSYKPFPLSKSYYVLTQKTT